jgi:uncharacterized DUF497 family protein
MYSLERIHFDEEKRKSVLKRRGVDLLSAVLILAGPTLTVEDKRHDYGEDRYIATGEASGEFYTIVYTTLGREIRVITAWRAGRRARRRYQEYLRSRAIRDA